jgi:hypothetical protein
MKGSISVVVSLVMAATAAAQEARAGRFNLLEDPAGGVEEEQEKSQEKGEKVIEIPGTPLQDELRHGETNKPMYTDHRISPQTRIYLQVDSGEVEFEQWVEIRAPKDTHETTEVRLSEEFEFGLGSRFQMDLYMNTDYQRNGRATTLENRSWAAEVRYALADWDVIWGNPTIYLEYILWNNDPAANGDGATSSIEPKLLLGGDLSPRFHWGANFFFEKTLNNSVVETGVAGTVFYTVVDKFLSAGLTVLGVYESDEHPGGTHTRTREFYVGPTFQLRMAPYDSEVLSNGQPVKVKKTRAHLDIEPVFGVTGESLRTRTLLVFGWDF